MNTDVPQASENGGSDEETPIATTNSAGSKAWLLLLGPPRGATSTRGLELSAASSSDESMASKTDFFFADTGFGIVDVG